MATNLPSQVYLSDSSLQPYAKLMLNKLLVEPYLAFSKQDTPIYSIIRFSNLVQPYTFLRKSANAPGGILVSWSTPGPNMWEYVENQALAVLF
jgi:hypothetical protein